MKIGLVRHFKVDHSFPMKRWFSKSEVLEWFVAYDSTTSIQYKDVDLYGINWKRCYSSPMIRAIQTAKHIFKGEIVEKQGLKELDILHQLPDRIMLPFIMWGIIVRVKSLFLNSDTRNFERRISECIDDIIKHSDNDTLIVSHWFVMRVIQKELIKRGFTGGSIKSNDYGVLYIFERL